MGVWRRKKKADNKIKEEITRTKREMQKVLRNRNCDTEAAGIMLRKQRAREMQSERKKKKQMDRCGSFLFILSVRK